MGYLILWLLLAAALGALGAWLVMRRSSRPPASEQEGAELFFVHVQPDASPQTRKKPLN